MSSASAIAQSFILFKKYKRQQKVYYKAVKQEPLAELKTNPEELFLKQFQEQSKKKNETRFPCVLL